MNFARKYFAALVFALLAPAAPGLAQEEDTTALLSAIREQDRKIWGNYPEELSRAISLYAASQRSLSPACQRAGLLLRGKYHWVNGEYDSALLRLHKARALAGAAGDWRMRADAADIMANTFYYQAYYDSALRYYNESIEYYGRVNDTNEILKVLNNISVMFHRRGDYHKTVEYILKKEKFQEEHPETVRLVEAFVGMGGLLIDTLYYNEIVQRLLAELPDVKQKGDLNELKRVYAGLADAHRQLGHSAQAARWYVHMGRVEARLGFRPQWLMAGIEYKKLNQKDSSFFYHRKSLSEFYQATRIYKAWVLELVGDAHLHFGQPDSALFYYRQAFARNQEMNNRITMAGIHKSLVLTYTALGRWAEAEDHLSAGIRLARAVALAHERDLYEAGNLLYSKSGNFEKAYAYLKQYTNLADSVNSQETALNLTRYQVEFKTWRTTRQVEDLQQQNTLKEAQIEVRNIQIALSLALAGLVATAGTFYFTQYKSKKKASEQLESKNRLIENQNSVLIHQNKEKEALLAEVHHRVKNNLQVMISMINIKSRNADPQAVSVLNEVVNRIYVLGLIYEMLYKSSSLQAISLKEYLEKQLLLTFSTGDSSDLGGIRYTLEADDIQADVETAMNVGLIHNELLTNITKYAFPAGQTHRSVLIRLLKEGDTVTFCVHDNGTRLAWSPGKVEPSFGLRLVEQLVTSKLNGKLSMTYEGGLRVEVTFPFQAGNTK